MNQQRDIWNSVEVENKEHFRWHLFIKDMCLHRNEEEKNERANDWQTRHDAHADNDDDDDETNNMQIDGPTNGMNRAYIWCGEVAQG